MSISVSILIIYLTDLQNHRSWLVDSKYLKAGNNQEIRFREKYLCRIHCFSCLIVSQTCLGFQCSSLLFQWGTSWSGSQEISASPKALGTDRSTGWLSADAESTAHGTMLSQKRWSLQTEDRCVSPLYRMARSLLQCCTTPAPKPVLSSFIFFLLSLDNISDQQ